MTRRLTPEELFCVGPHGLEPIGDTALNHKLDEIERLTLERQSDAGYLAACAEEALYDPEAT